MPNPFRSPKGDLPHSVGIASPWAEPSTLNRVVLSDIFGAELADQFPLSRAEAIAIPAVSKARNLLIAVIAPLPLIALDKNGPLTVQPSWLYRTDSLVTPYERMAWTVDDLVFNGFSLWSVTRGAESQITTAEYVPFDSWRIDKGRVLIDDKAVPNDSVILFNSPFGGLLAVASRTLRAARDIEATRAARVRNPSPTTVISTTGDEQLEDAEVADLLAQWNLARRAVDGAVGYLPPGLKFEQFGEAKPELFLDASNSLTTAIGQHLNIPSYMLDAAIEANFTYSTAEGDRDRFYAESLPFWTDPITARLSQDDVVPRGSRVRFDHSEQTASAPTPTGAPTED